MFLEASSKAGKHLLHPARVHLLALHLGPSGQRAQQRRLVARPSMRHSASARCERRSTSAKLPLRVETMSLASSVS
jgi:hypothetical protein